MTCLDCDAPTPGRFAHYCDEHRWTHRGRPRRYVMNQDRELQLRERYWLDGHCRARHIAKAWNWPTWAVKREAGRLGLTKGVDRRPWLPDELAFLEANAGSRHLHWLAKKLKRTEASVSMKLRKLRLTRRVTDGYTVRQLEEGLGVDHRAIDRWVERGWLRAPRRNPEATDAPGFPYQIDEREVVRFIREHSDEIPLHRVDPDWFFDLVLRRRTPATIGSAA